MALICGVLGWLEHQKELKRSEERKTEQDSSRTTSYGYFEGEEDDDFVSEPSAKKKKDLEEAVRRDLPKIYVASRTHRQIAQLVKELQRTSYNPGFTVLGSRAHYCVNEQVRKSQDINEECRKVCKGSLCTYYNNMGKQAKKRGFALIPNCDIEELVKRGKSENICPYFTARAAVEKAELVFAPYNYLIDPVVRESLGVELDRDIVIIDEAHNIEDTCREAGSFEVTDDSLEQIRMEINHVCDQLKNEVALQSLSNAHLSQGHVVAILLNWLRHVNSMRGQIRKDFETSITTWHENAMIEELNSLGINHDGLGMWARDLQKIIDKSNETQFQSLVNKDDSFRVTHGLLLSTGSCQVLQGLYYTMMNMLRDNNQYLSSYRMVKYQTTKIEKEGKRAIFTLGLWCLNPEVIFRQLHRNARSIILTSGTLSPMDSFSSELGSKFEQRLEAMHIITEKQTWVGCVTNGPDECSLLGNFKTMDSFAYQDDLCRAIQRVCDVVPLGVLCFLPSYFFMEKLIKRMQSIGIYDRIAKAKKVFLEPRQGTPKDFEKLMKNYYKVIKDCKGKSVAESGLNGALLFAIYRGKISEGLDLKDDNCRAVIPVGIPYPAFKDPKVMLKREFNDKQVTRKLLSGQHWYEIQAFRALNQALGRCIRHRSDWGAIILLEQRFTIAKNVTQLSKWVRGRLTTYSKFDDAMKSLSNFVQNVLN